jgi:hypothetical protein
MLGIDELTPPLTEVPRVREAVCVLVEDGLATRLGELVGLSRAAVRFQARPRRPNLSSSPVGLAMSRLDRHPADEVIGYRISRAMTTPIGITVARTPRYAKRRRRSAAGATTSRINGAGTSRNTGHRRWAQATIRPSNRPSIALLSPLAIARGYAPGRSTAEHAKQRPRRRACKGAVGSS